MIAIVDYGAGNLASVRKAFTHLQAEVVVTACAQEVIAADKVVLPGVGHFSSLQGLETAGLRSAVWDAMRGGKPFLGICLGMQWLFEGSDEAPDVQGTGIFPGRCRQFPPSVKVPHVGWNSLTVRKDSRLLGRIEQDSFVYYTHSFLAPVVMDSAGTSEYGLEFSGAVERGNIFGVQFHPEKSGDVGLAILRNFCEIRPC